MSETVRGARWEVVFYGQEIKSKIEIELVRRMDKLCRRIANTAAREMVPGTGRIYFKRKQGRAGGRDYNIVEVGGRSTLKESFKTRGGWGALSQYKAHQASAPDESPAPDTGHLKQSIVYEIRRKEDGKIVGYIGSNLPYARALEFGYAPHKLEPRPYLRPALIKELQAILDTFKGLA